MWGDPRDSRGCSAEPGLSENREPFGQMASTARSADQKIVRRLENCCFGHTSRTRYDTIKESRSPGIMSRTSHGAPLEMAEVDQKVGEIGLF